MIEVVNCIVDRWLFVVSDLVNGEMEKEKILGTPSYRWSDHATQWMSINPRISTAFLDVMEPSPGIRSSLLLSFRYDNYSRGCAGERWRFGSGESESQMRK